MRSTVTSALTSANAFKIFGADLKLKGTADCSKLVLTNGLQGLLICGQHHTSPYTSMYRRGVVLATNISPCSLFV